MSTLTDLISAREYLTDPENWIQEVYWDAHKDKVCMVGALPQYRPYLSGYPTFDSEAEILLNRVSEKYVRGIIPRDSWPGGNAIFAVNDMLKHQDVLAVLDIAIKACKEDWVYLHLNKRLGISTS